MKTKLFMILALCAAGALTASAADAKANWDQHCAKCHGADGKGQTTMGKKLKVKDYTDAKVQADMKDAEMIKATKEGVKVDDSVKMKGFGDVLSDDEIKALVTYIRAFKK
jgi:cytochrome c6